MNANNNSRDPLLISYLTLRKSIGFLGVSIPAVMLLGTFLLGDCSRVQDSISHYYFTIMGDVFVGFLIATGIFLLSYRGYDLHDRSVSILAGIFVLCIALFPTSQNPDTGCVIRTLPAVPFRIQVHYVSAALFYVALAYMSLVLFTKSSGPMTPEKKSRNRVYRVCAAMILISILLIFFQEQIPFLNTEGMHPTFWLEWVANLAYGLSWLTKGEFLLKDREVNQWGS